MARSVLRFDKYICLAAAFLQAHKTQFLVVEYCCRFFDLFCIGMEIPQMTAFGTFAARRIHRDEGGSSSSSSSSDRLGGII